MKKANRRFIKLRYLIALVLSLSAVAVGAISTSAWFSMSRFTYDGGQSFNSGSSDLAIGDAYGYKSVRQVDENGYLSIDENSVTKKQVGSEAISTENEDHGEEDFSFNIPFAGDGYYLLKKNAQEEFLYADSSTLKFKIYNNSNRLVIESADLVAGSVYRVMQYTNRDHTTINQKLAMNSAVGSCSVSSGDIEYEGSTGDFKVWVDKSRGTFGIEASSAVVNYNVASRIGGGFGPKKVLDKLDPANYKRIYLTRHSTKWSNLRLHYWDGVTEGSYTMTKVFLNNEEQEVYLGFLPLGSTGFQFEGYFSDWGRDVYTNDIAVPGGEFQAYYFGGQNQSGDTSKWYTLPWKTPYEETFHTYYYCNDFAGFSNPKAHVWMNTSVNNSAHGEEIAFGTMETDGENMDDEGGNIFSVSVPYYAGVFTHVIFYDDSSHRTVNLTNVGGNDGNTFEITGGAASGYTGRWTGGAPNMDTTYEYKVVDFGERLGSGNAKPYAHIWSSTARVYSVDPWPGVTMTQPTEDVRIFGVSSVSSDYDKIMFHDNGSNRTTADGIDIGADYNGKYFEINDGSGMNLAGRWTAGPARNDDNRTYYLYDKANIFNGTAYCYGWDTFDTPATTYYSTAPYPGVQMSLVSTTEYTTDGGSSTSAAKLYSVTISGDYDRLIFNNGTNSVATATLDNTSLAHSGQTFEMSSDRSGSWTDKPSASLYTYYLYDPKDVLGSGTHYAFGSGSGYYSDPPEYGLPMTPNAGGRSKMYSISLSQSYTSIKFSNGSNSPSTSSISAGAAKNGKVYVISSTTNGKWYAGVDDVSPTTRKFYAYDKPYVFGEDAPRAYAYLLNHLDDNSGPFASVDSTIERTYYTSTENATWKSAPVMTPATYDPGSGEPEIVEGLWEVDVSETYTHLIIHNGLNPEEPGAIQTTDSTALVQYNQSAYCPYFVLDGTPVSAGRYDGSWMSELSTVALYGVYFLRDQNDNLRKLNFPSETLGHDFVLPGSPYTASYTNPKTKSDTTNGIWYIFEPEGSGATWYTNSSFTAQYENPSILDGMANLLYIRFICDVDDLTTFYVDTSQTGHDDGALWGNTNVYAWKEINEVTYKNNESDPSNALTNFPLNVRVAPYLYRLTLPSACSFRLNNHGYDGGQNLSHDVTNLNAQEDGALLYLWRPIGVGDMSTTVWDNIIDVEIGTATIYVNGEAKAEMGEGDVVNSNYFIFEEGLNISQGDKVQIKISSPDIASAPNLAKGTLVDSTYVFADDQLINNIGGLGASFIQHSGEGYDSDYITFSETGRYTFYLTKEGEISIASVPILGNGFYIMPYTSTTVGFIGAKKMMTVDETSGYYNGWIAKADYDSNEDGEDDCTRIFVRSYMAGVDTLYTNIDTTALKNNEATIVDGVITLKPGKYNIRVASSTVYITTFAADDFFSLDPLDRTKSIYDNYTSLVYEVAFTTTNTMPVTTALDLEGELPNYLGLSFYVSKTPLGTELATYSYMRGNHFASRSNSSTYSSATVLSESGTYYAYILVDYLPTEDITTIPNNPSFGLNVYLRTVQA